MHLFITIAAFLGYWFAFCYLSRKIDISKASPLARTGMFVVFMAVLYIIAVVTVGDDVTAALK